MNTPLLTKVAAEYERLGFKDTQRAMIRASQKGHTGMNRFVAHPDLTRARLRAKAKGLVIGGGSGALLGFGAAALLKKHRGLGATLGGFLGAGILSHSLGDNVDREYLQERGIHPGFMFLTSRIEPEARKKYLSDSSPPLSSWSAMKAPRGLK